MNKEDGTHPIPGLVSVVVPLYNGAASICRCLDSILDQTYEHVEIVVIDDGSTDNSLAVIARYADKIKLLQQENRGPASARNLGIESNRGEFLSFIDSDDYWYPAFLEKCISVLMHIPRAVAVSTAARAVHWTGKEVVIPGGIDSGEFTSYRGGKTISDFFTFWAQEDHIRTGTVVINSGHLAEPIFQRADLRISEDLEYWGLLATYGDWAFLPEVLFVTDGIGNAASVGWLKKNKERRKMCPTVELWQERIVKRLEIKDQAGFQVMRGRIACNFAHAKVLAGEYLGARNIVQKYGSDFRSSTICTIMKRGNHLTWFGWMASCTLIRIREWLKALILFIEYSVLQKKV